MAKAIPTVKLLRLYCDENGDYKKYNLSKMTYYRLQKKQTNRMIYIHKLMESFTREEINSLTDEEIEEKIKDQEEAYKKKIDSSYSKNYEKLYYDWKGKLKKEDIVNFRIGDMKLTWGTVLKVYCFYKDNDYIVRNKESEIISRTTVNRIINKKAFSYKLIDEVLKIIPCEKVFDLSDKDINTMVFDLIYLKKNLLNEYKLEKIINLKGIENIFHKEFLDKIAEIITSYKKPILSKISKNSIEPPKRKRFKKNNNSIYYDYEKKDKKVSELIIKKANKKINILANINSSETLKLLAEKYSCKIYDYQDNFLLYE